MIEITKPKKDVRHQIMEIMERCGDRSYGQVADEIIEACKSVEPTDKDIQQSALYECLRPQIRKMANQMEQKFRLYDGERGDPFKPLTYEFLDKRFRGEWAELMEALGTAFRFDDEPFDGIRPSEVWKEGGDCCNVITMICANYERQYYEYHRKKKESG